jgi:hypothetical protein
METPLYELELRRPGRSGEERLYAGAALSIDAAVAIEGDVWRVATFAPPASSDAQGRLILEWAGLRRDEVARANAIALIEEATELIADSTALVNKLGKSASGSS